MTSAHVHALWDRSMPVLPRSEQHTCCQSYTLQPNTKQANITKRDLTRGRLVSAPVTCLVSALPPATRATLPLQPRCRRPFKLCAPWPPCTHGFDRKDRTTRGSMGHHSYASVVYSILNYPHTHSYTDVFTEAMPDGNAPLARIAYGSWQYWYARRPSPEAQHSIAQRCCG